MTSPSEPIGRLENGLTWPFRLASLNKERQGRPARRTGLESEKASAGAFTISIICNGGWKNSKNFLGRWPAAHKGSLITGRRKIVGANSLPAEISLLLCMHSGLHSTIGMILPFKRYIVCILNHFRNGGIT